MRKFKVTVNGISYNVEVQEDNTAVAITPSAAPAPVTPAPVAKTPVVSAPAAAVCAVELAAGETAISAPMPGKITKILVKDGDVVKGKDVLMLLEAMKMQNEITAPVEGKVKVNVSAGQSVKPGDVLVIIS